MADPPFELNPTWEKLDGVMQNVPMGDELLSSIAWMYDVVDAIPDDVEDDILAATRLSCEAALLMVMDASEDPALWIDPVFAKDMDQIFAELRVFLYEEGLDRCDELIQKLHNKMALCKDPKEKKMLGELVHTIDLQSKKAKEEFKEEQTAKDKELLNVQRLGGPV